jgi:hypothetical protein
VGDQRQNLRWGVERRLEFIEFRLFWEGSVNRGDLIDTFGVSIQQASTDLQRYQDIAPPNMLYDKSAKATFRSRISPFSKHGRGIAISRHSNPLRRGDMGSI